MLLVGVLVFVVFIGMEVWGVMVVFILFGLGWSVVMVVGVVFFIEVFVFEFCICR